MVHVPTATVVQLCRAPVVRGGQAEVPLGAYAGDAPLRGPVPVVLGVRGGCSEGGRRVVGAGAWGGVPVHERRCKASITRTSLWSRTRAWGKRVTRYTIHNSQ